MFLIIIKKMRFGNQDFQDKKKFVHMRFPLIQGIQARFVIKFYKPHLTKELLGHPVLLKETVQKRVPQSFSPFNARRNSWHAKLAFSKSWNWADPISHHFWPMQIISWSSSTVALEAQKIKFSWRCHLKFKRTRTVKYVGPICGSKNWLL